MLKFLSMCSRKMLNQESFTKNSTVCLCTNDSIWHKLCPFQHSGSQDKEIKMAEAFGMYMQTRDLLLWKPYIPFSVVAPEIKMLKRITECYTY